MRIFQEEEYEQPAVNRDGYGRNNSKRTSFYTEVQEPHEYDEEGLAERVVKPKLPEMKPLAPGDLVQSSRSGEWRLFGVSRLRLVEL